MPGHLKPAYCEAELQKNNIQFPTFLLKFSTAYDGTTYSTVMTTTKIIQSQVRKHMNITMLIRPNLRQFMVSVNLPRGRF